MVTSNTPLVTWVTSRQAVLVLVLTSLSVVLLLTTTDHTMFSRDPYTHLAARPPYVREVRVTCQNQTNTTTSLITSLTTSLTTSLQHWPPTIPRDLLSRDLPRLLSIPASFSVSPNETTFTIQMTTYRRLKLLPQLLGHYSAMKVVHRIILLWNDVDNPPDVSKLREMMTAGRQHDLFVDVQARNLLTNRMSLSDHVDTAAVLMMDDDLILTEQQLTVALETWRLLPSHLVGFTSRRHKYTAKTDTYSYLFKNKPYTMVLTNVALMHRDHYKMFTYIPRDVYNMIDELTNCEDIVINYFVSMLHGGGPAALLVDGGTRQISHNGLYTKKHHLDKRTHCINELFHTFGRNMLPVSKIIVKPFT